MRKYEFLVAYETDKSIGNIPFTSDHPAITYEGIEEIREAIRDLNNIEGTVIITNLIPLRESK